MNKKSLKQKAIRPSGQDNTASFDDTIVDAHDLAFSERMLKLGAVWLLPLAEGSKYIFTNSHVSGGKPSVG